MAVNQTELCRYKQNSLIKYLVAEKCQPFEIYRKMCEVNGVDLFFQIGELV